jgi:hypothetical protein
MSNTIVRVFNDFNAAQHVREALLHSGFSPDDIELNSTIDEAGPVEGNGVLDAKDTGAGPRDREHISPMAGEERTDAYNNSEPVWRGAHVLTVMAQTSEDEAKASAIMDRENEAIDIDALTSRALPSRRES